jgi:hypothetical protein
MSFVADKNPPAEVHHDGRNNVGQPFEHTVLVKHIVPPGFASLDHEQHQLQHSPSRDDVCEVGDEDQRHSRQRRRGQRKCSEPAGHRVERANAGSISGYLNPQHLLDSLLGVRHGDGHRPWRR